MYLAIDPGEKIGWATFDSAGAPTGYGELKGRDSLLEFLESDKCKEVQQVIIEDYRIFGHKAQAHAQSKVETTRVIGAIEAWATIRKLPKPRLQPSSILPIAQKWTGVKIPGHGVRGHDQWSAYNHGYYYLVNQGIIKLHPREMES